MRQIETSSLSNQNIATALNVHTYTADADRMLFVRLFADQVAGNGSYSAYITIQKLGAGSAYQVQPVTTAAVASGVTAIAFTTIPFPVQNTDVVKVYILGIAGDTTTPDIITGIWEDDSLVPTVTGRKLDVSSGGEAGVDWANVGSPTTTVALTGTTAGLIDNAITAAKIATDAIDADAIADGAITSGVFAANAITNAAVADDVVVGSVTGAVGSVTGNVGGNVAGSVGTVNALAANSVTALALATDAVAELIAAVFANDLESGKTFAQAVLDMWAKMVGDAATNDADDPTSTTYDSPDGTVQVTHTKTGTTRTKV
jgi:hypothetical protein